MTTGTTRTTNATTTTTATGIMEIATTEGDTGTRIRRATTGVVVVSDMVVTTTTTTIIIEMEATGETTGTGITATGITGSMVDTTIGRTATTIGKMAITTGIGPTTTGIGKHLEINGRVIIVTIEGTTVPATTKGVTMAKDVLAIGE